MPNIEIIPTGVPGLDRILGGGLPALSFNIISGDPGAGKTTLAHQMIFANATEERPALFCTVVGEPPIKMFRYQQQFDFFDPEEVGKAIHFQNLSDQVMAGDMEAVLEGLLAEIERVEPAFVVVDSFRSVAGLASRGGTGVRGGFQRFVQRLSIEMTRWEATTFLLGEFDSSESRSNPLFTVADGVFWLRHSLSDTDNRVRKIEVGKLRGAQEIPGPHIYRITDQGIRVYGRKLAELPELGEGDEGGSKRMSTGIEGLDEMMSGGLVPGDAAILSGPSGTGKSLLAIQFMRAGLEAGEGVVAAVFEESDGRFRERIRKLGIDAAAAEDEDRLRILHRRPLDLAMDETFEELWDLTEEIGAARVVIDSLSGLQVMTTGAEADRLRESLGRLILTLTDSGVTVLMTVELNQSTTVLRFTPHETSFLADDVILQRYVEIEGELTTVMAVVKMRRSDHSRAFHRYGITEKGIVVGRPLHNLHGILTGVPEMTGESRVSQREWADEEASHGAAHDPGREG